MVAPTLVGHHLGGTTSSHHDGWSDVQGQGITCEGFVHHVQNKVELCAPNDGMKQQGKEHGSSGPTCSFSRPMLLQNLQVWVPTSSLQELLQHKIQQLLCTTVKCLGDDPQD